MITTVADLLDAFRIKEEQLLESYGHIKHPVLIGSMYEGLTKNILDKSIFKDLDLRVTSGKIKNSSGEMSGEIDCMLVVGEGEKIPHTDKSIYDSSQVVTVIQVKKNLYSKDVKDSYQNLKSVIDVTEPREGEFYHGRILRDSFRQICQTELPQRSELGKLPFELEMIYHILLLDAMYPIRIVWGYNGFASEFSLRQGFIKYLDSNRTVDSDNKIFGYGPLNMPSLIMCEDSCIIKANGMPFGSAMDEGWWDLLVTSSSNPVYYFLEVIWTRLHYMFGINVEIFGDDLELDQVHPFLRCRVRKTQEMTGWDYYYNFISQKHLSDFPLEKKDWEPAFLDDAQFTIMNELCAKGEVVHAEDLEFTKFIQKSGHTLENFIKSLIETGLVYSDGTKLLLLTDKCVCGISSQGRYFAGDDKTGRVTRWVLKTAII